MMDNIISSIMSDWNCNIIEKISPDKYLLIGDNRYVLEYTDYNTVYRYRIHMTDSDIHIPTLLRVYSLPRTSSQRMCYTIRRHIDGIPSRQIDSLDDAEKIGAEMASLSSQKLLYDVGGKPPYLPTHLLADLDDCAKGAPSMDIRAFYNMIRTRMKYMPRSLQSGNADSGSIIMYSGDAYITDWRYFSSNMPYCYDISRLLVSNDGEKMDFSQIDSDYMVREYYRILRKSKHYKSTYNSCVADINVCMMYFYLKVITDDNQPLYKRVFCTRQINELFISQLSLLGKKPKKIQLLQVPIK